MNETSHRYRDEHAAAPTLTPAPAAKSLSDRLKVLLPPIKDLAAATVQDSYSLVTMPDGQVVSMQKLSDGTWVRTEERVNGKTTAFEQRFAGTETRPSPWNPSVDGTAVTPDVLKAMEQHKKTKDHIRAFLVTRVGTPENIVAKDPMSMAQLRELHKRPLDFREVLELIRLLEDTVWNEALKVITA